MLYILGLLVIITFGPIVGLGNRVPSLKLVELSLPNHILFVNFVVSYIMVFVVREGISVLHLVLFVTCNVSVLQGL